MKIGMYGMGFVGGTTARVLGDKHEVLPYDKFKAPYNTQDRADKLVREAEVTFICVPTPMKPSGEIDYGPMHDSLQLLTNTAERVGRSPSGLLVTVRSTAVSGTTDAFASQYPFPMAFNPEFLRERHAEEDMRATKHIVLGVADQISEAKLRAVYKPLFPDAEVIVTDRKTAEMAKYANNAALATSVIFSNAMYEICEAMGVNFKEIQKILSMDERNGKVMDVPGPDGDRGFGGKCFPKDLNALIHLARGHRVRPYFLEEVWRSNVGYRKNRDWEEIPGATSEKGFD